MRTALVVTPRVDARIRAGVTVARSLDALPILERRKHTAALEGSTVGVTIEPTAHPEVAAPVHPREHDDVGKVER